MSDSSSPYSAVYHEKGPYSRDYFDTPNHEDHIGLQLSIDAQTLKKDAKEFVSKWEMDVVSDDEWRKIATAFDIPDHLQGHQHSKEHWYMSLLDQYADDNFRRSKSGRFIYGENGLWAEMPDRPTSRDYARLAWILEFAIRCAAHEAKVTMRANYIRFKTVHGDEDLEMRLDKSGVTEANAIRDDGERFARLDALHNEVKMPMAKVSADNYAVWLEDRLTRGITSNLLKSLHTRVGANAEYEPRLDDPAQAYRTSLILPTIDGMGFDQKSGSVVEPEVMGKHFLQDHGWAIPPIDLKVLDTPPRHSGDCSNVMEPY